MRPLVLVFFTFIGLIQLVSCWEHFDAHNYLATKTPYPVPQTTLDKPEDLKSCRVIHINHVGRHGSRHMNNTHNINNLNIILTEAKLGNGLKESGNLLIKLLQEAKKLEGPENLKQLTELGKKEHRGIAERMYRAFEDLFNISSAQKTLVLQNTHVQRTKDSREAFLGRLKEINPKIVQHTRIISPEKGFCDAKLRFFDACNAYIAYKKNSYYKSMVHEIIWNKDAQQSINNILGRIFSADFMRNLDIEKRIEITRNIYNLCQLDANINSKTSENFCSFFSKETEIENFNWEEDALSYFSKGPADQVGSIAHQSACPLVSDFLSASEQAIKDPHNAPIAHLRFGHAETIIPFLVLLGLYNQDSSADILTQPEKRSFRTAQLSPMGANIQWVLYACPDEEYRVRMLHNEKDISFPIKGCEASAWCRWQKVKNFLSEEARSCDHERFEQEICRGVSCKHETEVQD